MCPEGKWSFQEGPGLLLVEDRCWLGAPDRKCLCCDTFGLIQSRSNVSLLIIGGGFNLLVVTLIASVLAADQNVKHGHQAYLWKRDDPVPFSRAFLWPHTGRARSGHPVCLLATTWN